MYQVYVIWALKWSSTSTECVQMDGHIREQHQLFLSIKVFSIFYTAKFHNQLKAAKNYMDNGPLRCSWAMKLEMYLRSLKGYGTRSNFKNVTQTMAVKEAQSKAYMWATMDLDNHTR
jgi:hypothetical protein